MKKALLLAGGLCANLVVLGGPTVATAATPVMKIGEVSAAEKVAQRCWWRNGVRHCSRVYGYGRDYGYGSDYGYGRAEDYPTGSSRWWRQMDREGRGGRGAY